MMHTRRPGYGILASNEAQFFGADSNVTELRGILCDPEDTNAVVRVMSDMLNGPDGPDWIQWRGLRVRDEQSLSSCGIDPIHELNTTVHILKMPATWDELRAALPRNAKEAIRKCYNSLARNGIAFKFQIIEAPDAVPTALDVFFALHKARSEETNTVSHSDAFASSVSRSFLIEYCTALAQRDGLRIFQLEIDGKVIATRLGFVFGDELYLYYSGYDGRWGRYSIMTTVVTEAIKWAIENKFKIVNLSTGTDVSKTRWRPDAILYRGGYSVRRSLWSRAVFSAVSHYRSW